MVPALIGLDHGRLGVISTVLSFSQGWGVPLPLSIRATTLWFIPIRYKVCMIPYIHKKE